MEEEKMSLNHPNFKIEYIQCHPEFQVALNTTIQDEKKLLDHIIKSTKMKCLTPPWLLLAGTLELAQSKKLCTCLFVACVWGWREPWNWHNRRNYVHVLLLLIDDKLFGYTMHDMLCLQE